MLYDRDFLLELDKTNNKIIYAKVTALTFEEFPVSTIEGRVTQGSINIDGASAVRRSCSLSLIAQDFDYSNYTWGVNTKFKLEIGVHNFINPQYPEIIWFNQGIYVITSFNASRSTSNFTISIQGKDKMCLLNGEVSGTIGVQTDFGTIEEEDADGVWTIRSLPIEEIIKNLVHSYAGEPYHNIVIKDLNDYGLELLEYRYDNVDLYLYRYRKSNTYINTILGNSTSEYFKSPTDGLVVTVGQFKDTQLETLTETLGDDTKVPYFFKVDKNGTRLDDKEYVFTRIRYGDTAGYRVTDLTYAGDLIANVGESITSVLDKIKNMLVEFEYFYDVDGRFIFQKKQSFISTMWQTTKDDDDSIQASLALSSTSCYDFNGGELITSFNNNPNLLNVKNDFSIWGERTGVSGAKLPIHLRYAVDIKPSIYTTIKLTAEDKEEIKAYNDKYGTTLSDSQSAVTYSTKFPLFKCSNCGHMDEPNKKNPTVCPRCGKSKMSQMKYKYVSDWREVLHIMALDYFKYNILDNFEIRVRDANKTIYPSGQTGYEQYYTDIEVCWKQLYNNELKNKISKEEKTITTAKKNIKSQEKKVTKKEKELNTASKAMAALTAATTTETNEEVTQDMVDEANAEVMTISNELNELKVQLDKYKYTLEQSEEKLAQYEETLENFYQIEETPEVNANTTYYTLPSGHSVFDKNKVTLQLNASRTKYQFIILKDDVTLVSEEEGSGKKVIYSPWDNYYLIVDEEYEDEYLCSYLDAQHLYWNKDVSTNPSVLNYWFDFLDTEGELSQFNVKAIGSRTKAVNETTVKSIYFRETPTVIYGVPNGDGINGYKYININEAIANNMFTISAQGKSAKDRLDELLYSHGYCSESATITTIPIYYLQPNTRIHLYDPETKLDGDYIVSKITISLAYNGTMQLTTTKAAQTIFF